VPPAYLANGRGSKYDHKNSSSSPSANAAKCDHNAYKFELFL
jgi:hypothetical protein